MKTTELTVINHYGLFPLEGGGTLATRGLYQALSEWYNINIATLYNMIPLMKDEVELSERLRVYQLSKYSQQLESEKLIEDNYGISIKTGFPSQYSLMRDCVNIPGLVNRLNEIAADSSVIVAEHAYSWQLVKAVGKGKKLWYRAQNVEYDYARMVWENYNPPKEFYDLVFECERECCNTCEAIFTISEDDANRFHKLYGVSKDKIVNISAGYDFVKHSFSLPSHRYKENNSNNPRAVFISSEAQMAVDAGNEVIKVAKEIPNIDFIIAGRVGLKLDSVNLPNNLKITGFISNAEKDKLLRESDFALNPIAEGSGLNIKMLEYFSYGIPVITTKFGIRGVDAVDGEHCIITTIGNLKKSIIEFCNMDYELKDKIVKNAFSLLCDKYSWRSSASKIINYVKSQNPDTDCLVQKSTPLYHTSFTSYIPKKPFYIRGCGEYGKICLDHLASIGLTPVAFLDEDHTKHGTSLNGVDIRSSVDCLNNCYEVIITLTEWTDAVIHLLKLGVSVNRLSVGLPGWIFKLDFPAKSIPHFIDEGKLNNLLSSYITA